MATFRERFETRMTQWLNNEKSDTEVFPLDYDRVRAYLWSSVEARKTEEASSNITLFGGANYRALGSDNYNNMLRKRECCTGCVETYKLENLSMCVECDRVYCYRCADSSCYCGGELVG
ncbi:MULTISPECIES: hypothetical protein [unclassified Microcoleus]|uniref:hypothetical protein n=1 Tax=unclassified Microcoleus TaxID=2642155 RepID=UPI002FD3DCD6